MQERSTLSEISEKRAKNGELSTSQRQLIIDMASRGVKHREIADMAKCSRSAVLRTVRRWKQNKTTTSLQRSGRPNIASPQVEKAIIQTVRENPKLTYREIAELATPYTTTQKPPSRTFLFYTLRKEGLHNPSTRPKAQ